MKPKIRNKKSGLVKSAEQQFIIEQEYAEQGYQLVDPAREVPGYIDENGFVEDGADDTDWEKLPKGINLSTGLSNT